ncbi:MAG TPA: hypothetical protein ENJ99_01530 [Rhizobiales bacterium]|nr:hypothetical protein [Hyphomicrobiales bacterium]
MKRSLQTFILFFLCLAVFAGPVSAKSEPDGIVALLDGMAQKAGGDRPVYQTISDDGMGNVTLSGLSWHMNQKGARVDYNVEKLSVSNLRARGNGVFAVGKATFANTRIIAKGPQGKMDFSYLIPETTIRNGFIYSYRPEAGAIDNIFAGSVIGDTTTIPSVQVDFAGIRLAVNGIDVVWSGDPQTGFGTWKVTAASLVVPKNLLDNPKTGKNMLDELGYEKLDIAMNGDIVLEKTGDKLGVGYGIRLTAQGMGTLEIAFAGRDIPGALFDMAKTINTGGKPDTAKILPLLFGIKLSGLKFRFEDNSLTRRLLDYAAKQQNTTPEAMTANGAAMIQISLAQLGLSEFAGKVVAAYNAYMASPKNITIRAKPENPVAIATIMGLAAAPTAAITMLGISVSAND